MSEMVERVARALMLVVARLPADTLGCEVPVLALDPDFDDLPRDHTEGTDEDEITQEAVRRLARAAIAAMREPDKAMLHAAAKAMSPGRRPTPDYVPVADKHAIRYRAMIDEALKDCASPYSPSPAAQSHG